MREGWVELSLGELTENTRPICYGVLKPGPQVEGGVPLVKITDMDKRILGPEGMQQISNELDNEYRRSRLQGGEVLLSIQGTVGRVAIAASTLKGANISRTIAVIDPDNRLHNFYLMYVLEKIAAQRDFDSAGSTRESLNISTIRDMKVLCPPLPEQKRIVDLISSVDSYVEALQQQLKSAYRSRNAVLHELMTADDDDWIETPISDVAKVLSGYAFKSDLFNKSEGIPLIRIRDLPKRNSTEALYSGSYEDRYIVKKGDFLIGMDGEFHCYEWNGPEALLNQRVCRIQDFKISRVVPRYIYFAVNQYLDKIEQDTGYTTVKHISAKQVLGIRIPLPPLPEQKRIVEVISEMDDFIESIQRILVKAKSLRFGLLSDLLIGAHEIPASYDKVIGAA